MTADDRKITDVDLSGRPKGHSAVLEVELVRKGIRLSMKDGSKSNHTANQKDSSSRYRKRHRRPACHIPVSIAGVCTSPPLTPISPSNRAAKPSHPITCIFNRTVVL